MLFWPYYYNLPIGSRSDIQNKLMGSHYGINWAEHYDDDRESFPPKKGTKQIGSLDWSNINPDILLREGLTFERRCFESRHLL